MSHNYAVCILFPGNKNDPKNIALSAARHDVTILMKEFFDPKKEYSTYFNDFKPEVNSRNVYLLFLFSSDFSILADSEEKLAASLETIKKYKKEGHF